MSPDDVDIDVAVIGGGQAGLAVGYYLRRAGRRFVIPDDQRTPVGALDQQRDAGSPIEVA